MYVHPEGSNWYDKNAICKNGVYILQDELLEIIENVGDVAFIIGGDFNARTGCEIDYVEDDIFEYLEGKEHSFLGFYI